METKILYWIPIERLALITDIPLQSLYDESFDIERTSVNGRDFVFVTEQIIKLDWEFAEKHNSYPVLVFRTKAKYHNHIYPAITFLKYTNMENRSTGEQEKG